MYARIIETDADPDTVVNTSEEVTNADRIPNLLQRYRLGATLKNRDQSGTFLAQKSEDGSTWSTFYSPSAPFDDTPRMARIYRTDTSSVIETSEEATTEDAIKSLIRRFRLQAELLNRDEEGTYTVQYSTDSGSTWS